MDTRNAPPLDLPLRFMAVAVGVLAVLAAVYPWHLPLLTGSFYDPHLTTFVHVNTLGLVAATIVGASYQMLPIVLQTPLASVRLARLSWWLYVPGLLAFVAGLSQGLALLLVLGGVLLYGALGLYAGVAAATLRRTRHRDVVFWHVCVALAGLVAALQLALLLALSKRVGFLDGRTLPVMAAHATLMVAGWVLPTLTGVGYRLVGMFTLTEDQLRPGWARAELALAAAGAWARAAALLLGLGRPVEAAGALSLLGSLAMFAIHLGWLYRRRRRRGFDVHVPFLVTSVGYALAAAALLAAGFVADRPAGAPIWVAVGWLAIVGCAETAIQGFLYKIGSFLAWLHRYAPLVGRRPVPVLDQLYGRRTALAGWALWSAGVALGGAAALASSEPVALAAAAALSLGAAAFLVNAARVARHALGLVPAPPAKTRSVHVNP